MDGRWGRAPGRARRPASTARPRCRWGRGRSRASTHTPPSRRSHGDGTASGATVLTASVDVADEAAMRELFERLGESMPPIRGVVHAAGVVRLRDAAGLDEEAMRDVLRPKVAGAWVLHEKTRTLPLDFFADVSRSVASVWSSRKLADYAAANSFLDGLAHHRQALGLPALSVTWGPWDGAGMVDASGLRALARTHAASGPAAGRGAWTLLGQLLTDPAACQATVAAVDWAKFAPLHRLAGRGRLLDEVAGAEVRSVAERTTEPRRRRTFRIPPNPKSSRGRARGGPGRAAPEARRRGAPIDGWRTRGRPPP